MARGKSQDSRRRPRPKHNKTKNRPTKYSNQKHKSYKFQEMRNKGEFSETGAIEGVDGESKRRKVMVMSSSRLTCRPSTRPPPLGLLSQHESSGEDSIDEQSDKCNYDPYTQLLSTFSTFDSNLQKKAIESDDGSEDDDLLGQDVDTLRPSEGDIKDGHKHRPSCVDANVLSPRPIVDRKMQVRPTSVDEFNSDSTMPKPNIGLSLVDPSQTETLQIGRTNAPVDVGLGAEHCSPRDSRPSNVQSNQVTEDDVEEDLAKDDADESSDPFAQHFHYDLDNSLYDVVSEEPLSVDTHHQNWPVIGHFLVQLPKQKKSEFKVETLSTKMTIVEKKKFAETGSIPKLVTSLNQFQVYIKPQIRKNISKANAFYTSSNIRSLIPLSPLQRELFSLIHNYQDVYFPYRTLSNGEEVRFVYCLHVVNHILKTRSKIIHHNAKLAKKDEVPEEFRDQGLVRPKVVILVPFRESALRVVRMIIAILFQDEKENVMHMKRFVEEHSGEEISMPKKHPRPEDYESTFVGNTDDTFRIGMTVTRKSLKLYADFYMADIIVASPLGLRMIVGAEGEADRDFDFLASIELLVLDQTELFLMQNWDHLLHVLDHIHLQPKESHGTDFSRVRSWALNGWTHYYRQTLVFSSLLLPEISAVFNKRCHNYAGKIKVINPIPTGTICQVVVQLPQVFYRFDASSATQAIDARLDFFVKKILPQFKDTIMSHTMVFIPSYFDFVCLRNYFKQEDMSFVQICEYSKEGKVARARDMFFHTEAHFLLYSERFHFFRRFRIKGIRHLIFYQPPTFPHLYSEMCNLMHEANQNRMSGNESDMTVTVMYSKYDVQQLAALVGTDRSKRMVASERSVHMFMTGE